jgi:hypothetical protein
MIEVYLFSTPNSIRVPIALEELGLHYEVIPVNVRKGEQKLAKFLTMNPNGTMYRLLALEGQRGRGGAPGPAAFDHRNAAAQY